MNSIEYKEFLFAIKQIKAMTVAGNLHKSYVLLPAHLLLSLYYIHVNETMGKYSLSTFMGVKPSRARKIITILVNQKVLISNKGRKGSYLTKKGEKICQSIFSQLVVYSIKQDLGALTLGTIDFVLSIPLSLVVNDIKAINIRDAAMKIGALGATIFRSFSFKNHLRISFYEQELKDSHVMRKEFTILESLLIKIFLLKPLKEHLLIATSTDPLPQYYFNPLFDSNIVTPHHINQLAGFHALWGILQS